MIYKTFKGKEIETIFEELANVRITVFREFPYLYEGSVGYEKEYLKTYSSAERSFLFAVYDGDSLVGATTAVPLADETAEVKRPFLKAGLDLDSIFYFGESILLQPYRGLGIGNRFFDERENHARSYETYKMTCFCSVSRPENHPLKPFEYQPHDKFWIKRGYQKNETLESQFDWLDLNENGSTLKPMIFWTKNL